MNSRLSRQWACRMVATGLIVAAVGVHEAGKYPNSANAAGTDRSSAIRTNAPSVSASATNAATAAAGAPVAPVKGPPMPDIKLTPALAEVVKMIQAGVSDEVLAVYIGNATNLFQVGLDQILYLNDIGVSSQVITALMQHDKQFTETTTPESIRAALAGAGNAAPVLTPKAGPPPTGPAAGTGVAVAAAPVTDSPPPVNTLPQEPAYGVPAEGPQPVVAGASPEVNNTYNYFSTALSPYGTWLNVGDYGWCWQPTVVVVNSGWRPYYDRGRWAYTDCGWYWLSDYSWGWATFHYGRWYSHPSYGWLWTPGSVWSPAWVSWRSSSSYCGWAPLPPAAHYYSGIGFSYYGSSVGASFEFGLTASHYTFIPLERFCDYYPHRYAVTPGVAHNVYNQTIVANNFIQGNNNNIVINRSIPPAQVAAASRSEIRKATVRELAAANGASVKPERLDKVGSDLVIFRPQLPAATPSQPDLLNSRVSRAELPKQRSSTASTGAPTAAGAPTRNAQGNSPATTLTASDGSETAVPGNRPIPVKPVPSTRPARSPSAPPTRVEELADATIRSDVTSSGIAAPRREPELGLKPYGQRPSNPSSATVPSTPQSDAANRSEAKPAQPMAPVPAHRPAYRPRPVPTAPFYNQSPPVQPSSPTTLAPAGRIESPGTRFNTPFNTAEASRPQAVAPVRPPVTYSAPATPVAPQTPAAPAYQPYTPPSPAPTFRPQAVPPPQQNFQQRPVPSAPAYIPPPAAPPPASRPAPVQPAYRPEPSAPAYQPYRPPSPAPTFRPQPVPPPQQNFQQRPAQPAYRPEPSAPAYRPPPPPPPAPSVRPSSPAPSAPSAPPSSGGRSSGRGERGK